MSNRRSPLYSIGVAVITVLAGATTANADDTEIYLGQPTTAAEGRPNILFILDTSGSMNGQVQTQTPYDPNETYDGDCAAGLIYWKSSTSPTTGVPVDRNCNFYTGSRFRIGDSDSTTGYVPLAAFKCQTALNVLNQTGFQPVSKTAQWRSNKWQALRRTSSGNNNYIECADDSNPAKMSPPHGDGTEAYAADGSNGPYTDEAAQQISWSTTDTSGTYTYYTSNYLNWYYNARLVTKTRLEIVQESLINTVDTLTEANVGLMRFSTNGEGGMVLKEVADVSSAGNDIKLAIDGLFPTGTTPLSETYYEAIRYWFGLDWDYGSSSQPTVSVPASLIDADTYRSPVSSSCQKNFIVYLTDGEPVADSVAQAKFAQLPGFQSFLNEEANVQSGGQCTPHSGTNNSNGVCMDDLAGYLFNTDIDSTQPGSQNVITYSVGFGSDVQNVNWAIDLLAETARRGGGTFYQAGDTATLTEVFTNIVQEILAVNTTFTAPTVAVNAFNRTQNLNDLYISVFGTPQPAALGNTYHWPGNIKRYEIRPDGTIVGAGSNTSAVDASTGFFSNSARSFWSSVVDGSDVNLGGAAHRLPTPATRNLYTEISGNDLTVANNEIAVANANITADLLGIDASTTITRDALVEWVRGADVDATDPAERDDPRWQMGDPLHARPVTVIYGGTAAAPDMVLYSTTNDGYLHAIDTTTGAELWSYVPSHLLRRMKDLYENRAQPAKRYALDGNLVVHKIDENNNGLVDGSDKVYLFFGMGRGGESYFALDITEKTNPQFMWRIGSSTEIDSAGNLLPSSKRLPGLAQTWSTPVVTKVRIGSIEKLVLIFGGGYDPTQDNVDYNTDNVGNRIYMVDALTGDLLWRAGPASDSGADLQIPNATDDSRRMNNSIPADIRVLDLDGNKLADRMYASDTGGRIWRFDIHNGQSTNSLVTGGVIASLGVAGGNGSNPTDARRFYYAPDIALIRHESGNFLNIAIGSGYRGHPLNTTIHDRFYSIRDYQIFGTKTQSEYNSYAYVEDDSSLLIDVTNDVTPTLPPGTLGWKIDLNQPSWQGEKVLAEANTFDNTILFTTYLPNDGNQISGSNSCVARQGSNRLYAVKALDASPTPNRDGSFGTGDDGNNQLGTEDRYQELDQSGIAPEAVILFPGTSTPQCIVGVEQCGISFSNTPVRTFWTQQDVDTD